MSVSTPSPGTNRLAKLVLQPGGFTANEAAQAAEAKLEAIRERVVEEIEATLDRMQAVGTALRAGPDEHAIEELYVLANTVVGMAGVFGMESLGEASYSLCDLIDRLRSSQKWNGPAVQVHLDSLRFLRWGADGDKARRRAIVEALKQVVSRL